MKKLLFLVLLTFLFSCEKTKESTDQCWICTEKANNNIVRTWEVCDVLEASHQDGRRWITYVVISPVPNYVTEVTVHTVNCEQE